jgi:hypothetical protein
MSRRILLEQEVHNLTRVELVLYGVALNGYELYLLGLGYSACFLFPSLFFAGHKLKLA